jgi:hypothetical protein
MTWGPVSTVAFVSGGVRCALGRHFRLLSLFPGPWEAYASAAGRLPGRIVAAGGITDRLLAVANAVIGRLPRRLGY